MLSNLESIDSCPICQTETLVAEQLLESNITAYGKELFYSVDICKTCGLIFSRKRSYFKELYSLKCDPEKDHSRQQRELGPLIPSKINAYQTKVQQAKEIIDLLSSKKRPSYGEIGASDGSLFRLVLEQDKNNDRAIKSMLVESSGAAAPCEQLEGCRVYSTDWRKIEFSKQERFDIFVLSHCLEHFTDPSALLSQIREALADDGHILVEVPDASRYDYSIAYPLGYFHILNFNLINLTWFMEKCGFSVKNIAQREWSPGIRIIAQKNDAKTQIPPPHAAVLWSRGIIQQWNCRRQSVFDNLVKILGKELREPTLIFGTGVHSKALLDYFPQWITSGNCFFADSDKSVNTFLGCPVTHPHELDCQKYEKILISSYSFQEEMTNRILEMGYDKNNIITLYDNIFSY